ncbi:hypothetical protein BJP65_14360 [Microbacterium sp. BH-3-3-3]|nr:hypothetical protein BJP65_14360 [Microbacterium sp. BH-3-3-3]
MRYSVRGPPPLFEGGGEGGDDAVDDDVWVAVADVEGVEPDGHLGIGGIEHDDVFGFARLQGVQDVVDQLQHWPQGLASRTS